MEAETIKLEQVKNCKYLGAQIQNNAKQEAEINERIRDIGDMLCVEQKLFKDVSGYRKDS